jgi:hypothetical protein
MSILTEFEEQVRQTSEALAKQGRRRTPDPTTFLSVVAVGVALSGVPITSIGVGAPPSSLVRSASDETVAHTGTKQTTSEETSPQTMASMVRQVHDMSGLTWDQLARLFGVSRRAIHHWASGGNMSARNIETLVDVMRSVRKLPGPDSANRRSQLLMPVDGGVSLYERLLRRLRPDTDVIEGSYLPPEYLLGSQQD